MIKRSFAKIFIFSFSGLITISLFITTVLAISIGVLFYEYSSAKTTIENNPLEKCGHPLKSNSVPVSIIAGIMAQEDHLFFQHAGFNWNEVEESVKKNLEKGHIVRGASTIDMQVASLCYLKDINSRWLQKFKEVFYTRIINARFSKHEIMRAYLTIVPLIEKSDKGGFPAAARYYFGKELSALNYDEIWGLILTLRSRDSLNPHALKKRNAPSKLAIHTLISVQPKQIIIYKTFKDFILKQLVFTYDDDLISKLPSSIATTVPDDDSSDDTSDDEDETVSSDEDETVEDNSSVSHPEGEESDTSEKVEETEDSPTTKEPTQTETTL